MECEAAETFVRKVKVVEGGKVTVLAKPDMNADPTGEYLSEGESTEVVARYACQRDGRVYLRLRKERGSWISTRARKDISKVVLAPLPGEAALEPSSFGEPLDSRALRLLPKLDVGALSPSKVPAAAPLPPQAVVLEAAAAGEATAAEDENEEDVFDEEQAEEGEDDEGQGDDGEEEEEEEGEGDVEVEAVVEAYGAATAPVAAATPPAAAEAAGSGTAAAAASAKRVRRFKVVAGVCPVLRYPGARELMATGHQVLLKMKDEFWADAAVFVPGEGRTYLRLTRGQGWVCERSRRDLRRCAVVPSVRRKKPLSRRRAMAIAFQGGDAEGATRLRKGDLMRNSQGRIVSKKASEAAKKRYADGGAAKWLEAVKRARLELNVEGFVPAKKGTALYAKARWYFEESKKQRTQ